MVYSANMSILSDILAIAGQFMLSTISYLNYPGIFFLMALESMVFPVPSEVVMPYAGYLVFKGQFNIVLVIVFSSLGSIVGSLLSYYIGKRWGIKLIESYGKYVLVDIDDLKKTQEWFDKRGELTIFFSRLIPVVRHLISIVAGVGKMNVKKFSLYTIAGATIWNSFLAYLGYVLGQNWENVSKYSGEIDIIVVIALILGVTYFIYRHITKRKKYRAKKK
jgi:membrane protein DedA with SNARE-associated domain